MIDTKEHVARVQHLLSLVRYQSRMWYCISRIIGLLHDGKVHEADLALGNLADGYLGGLSEVGTGGQMTELGRRLKEAADHLSGALFII